jgi:hypothetical protein
MLHANLHECKSLYRNRAIYKVLPLITKSLALLIDFIQITTNYSLLITTKNGAQNEFIVAFDGLLHANICGTTFLTHALFMKAAEFGINGGWGVLERRLHL